MNSGWDREWLLKIYSFNLAYSDELVRDIPDEQMYKSFGAGLENYPAFTLGHLVIASAMIAEDLGDEYNVPERWDDYFRRRGPDDPRLPSVQTPGMPAKNDLLLELKNKHARVETLINSLSTDDFKEPIDWRFDGFFPTIGEYLGFMCTTHEAMHLGQLAAWRRAAGLPSALGRL